MAGRTFVFGDLHGDLAALERVLEQLPRPDASDTLVFLGDYLDRGPDSAAVIELLRHELPARTPARLVTLRGNHEDAWLRVLDRGGWPEFTLPPGNGCRATQLSYLRQQPTADDDEAQAEAAFLQLHQGAFFPPEVVRWLRQLPHWYEDAHAIYVHAGLVQDGARWPHPAETSDPSQLLWVRQKEFWGGYRGKRVVVGHTATRLLPQEFSSWTPEDPGDLWAGPSVIALDTGAGRSSGFLTALELPGAVIYESRAGQGV